VISNKSLTLAEFGYHLRLFLLSMSIGSARTGCISILQFTVAASYSTQRSLTLIELNDAWTTP